MVDNIQYCEACGAKMIAYKKKLNKPICSAMIKIYKKLGANQFGDIAKLDNLSHQQKCNFQVLEYWGMMKRPSPEDKTARGGWWAVTDLGEKFIKGEVSMPIWIRTYRGKAKERSNEMVKISDVVEGYEDKAYHLLGAENVSDL